MNKKQAEKLAHKINSTPGYKCIGIRKTGYIYEVPATVIETGDRLLFSDEKDFDLRIADQKREEELYS